MGRNDIHDAHNGDTQEEIVEGRLSQFGAVCRALMVAHGVETDKEMVDRLRKAGHRTSVGSFSHWLHGKNSAPRWFCQEFADMLELDETERFRLARAYAYGQHLPIGSAKFNNTIPPQLKVVNGI